MIRSQRKPLQRTSRSKTSTLYRWAKNAKQPEGTYGAKLPTFSPEKVRESIESGTCGHGRDDHRRHIGACSECECSRWRKHEVPDER
ncbi:hypothetical protein [Streptomonospora litoralis]|uniref:Uncharacterized protein n=1 Tax=Streptomonospora litoralis TaxID=2498135 RepID=A0A4P6QB21_9ACTN|nr:hypothetical protein [Streptomonospora litoralis]QBI56849.1 hypothetical protein EKD16_25545 [Streptomonospora litoralis]